MTADTTAAGTDQDEPERALASAEPQSWRGIASEHVDDVSAPLAALLRRRSRLLLENLLAPHRRAVGWTAVAIVVSSLAALAGPWLVGVAIDNGIPPLLKSGDVGPLLLIAGLFAATVAVQAIGTRMFVTMTGRIGQAVVLELRRRLFAHLLRLSVSFHESYTSGRVISRQTSDVEAISALFEEGLDALITAVLTLLLVGTGMLLLDWQLGLVVLSGFIPLTWLSGWFRRESAAAYRRIRESNALVGETGAGKTSVARLIARFYDPNAGQVLLDGVDLRGLPDSTLRQEIVLITQESFLFEGSVAENIRLGRPSASDREVEEAARAIGAHQFIAALPQGYATKVGKRGGKLSAGQRQLLSFCRAFIAAPSVLVLDEATALLDIPSERLVQSALRTVLADRTALIIAHRLSTVAIADRVLVLRSGEVIEDGSPAELMRSGVGEYADLHARWAASLA